MSQSIPKAAVRVFFYSYGIPISFYAERLGGQRDNHGGPTNIFLKSAPSSSCSHFTAIIGSGDINARNDDISGEQSSENLRVQLLKYT